MSNNMIGAGGNVILGLFTLSLGISAIASSQGEWQPDDVGVGIWGGIYLLFFGGLLTKKQVRSNAITVVALAAYAIGVGAVVIGIHSWSVDLYQPYISDCANGNFSTSFGTIPFCNRVAVDSMLITSGILIVLLNAFVAATAKSMANQDI